MLGQISTTGTADESAAARTASSSATTCLTGTAEARVSARELAAAMATAPPTAFAARGAAAIPLPGSRPLSFTILSRSSAGRSLMAMMSWTKCCLGCSSSCSSCSFLKKRRSVFHSDPALTARPFPGLSQKLLHGQCHRRHCCSQGRRSHRLQACCRLPQPQRLH